MLRTSSWLFIALLSIAAFGCQAPSSGSDAGSGTDAGSGSNSDAGGAATQGGAKYGGVAVFANRNDPSTFDPLVSAGITTLHITGSIFGNGNLVKQCREDVYRVCPALAESWEVNSDFTQWTFKMRDGVYWHDGTKFTAEDFAWWLDVWYNGFKVGDKTRPAAATKALWGDLDKIERIGENQVRLSLGNPQPVFLDQITDPGSQVALPRHLVQARMEAGEVTISPPDVGNIGLGPFTFVKYDKGSQVQVRRFDKYWEKDEKGQQLPYLDGIDFPIVKDMNTVIASFRTGRLDGGARGTGFSLLPPQIAALKRDMGDKVQFVEIAGQRWYLLFNVLRPGPTQDVRVRKAMSLWIDKRAGNEAVMGGQGVITTLMDPRSPWPNPGWEQWPGFNKDTRTKDREDAKKLMADASQSGGFDVVHLCRSSWATFCEWLQADLAGLGVNMPLDLKDDATWVKWSRSTTDWDTQILRLDRKFPEAMEAQVGQASLASGTRIKHEDPKVTDFFRRLDDARTMDQRLSIYRELERYLLVDQVYAIPLFDEVFVFPYRSYVKGLMAPPEDVNQNLDFATVWLDK